MNKRFLLAMIFLLTGFISFAQYSVQSKYFVYLQTEPAQPFFIKINGQRIEANSSGYLILPQLKDGDYRLVVGFQDNKSPEMTFKFKIDSKDKGYLIKNFGADGWSLFDLQTMDVQKPLSAEEAAALAKTEAPKPQPRRQEPKPQPKQETPAPVVPAETAAVQQTPQPVQQPPAQQPPAQQTPAPVENSSVSDFTKVLSKAANNPGLLEQPKPEEKPVEKAETPAPAENKDSEKDETPQENGATRPEPEAPAKEPGNSSTKVGKGAVVKLSQHSSGTGTVVLYEDRSTGGKTEQIEITIPAAAKEASEAVKPAAEKEPAAADGKEDEQVAAGAKPLNGQENGDGKKKEKPAAAAAPAAPGNCKTVATEDDFLKLRRDMAGKENDEQMIEEARRAFKMKCYTSAQVKYISSMFLSNAGKYNFFEAARAHVADPENFGALQSEIKDDYYKEKFNGLIK
ncbi:DUF4476 domain-containing protein [Niabella drilacis]|uniref:DUF4476 domain-containing protein n=1 Tax=Niabella drilacis (strain DSM 25811 / CCM 8410 / CCUG 62505 / LMG 26954 / E90) TaxID=1285928 RepID=A0A1G6TGN2_NIADE|nr:DUF4476 domain-containing protein [Niabella drilacis]SDD28230.1 hypothetical protein SAMN04487894_107209 [Niabella drilacis]